MMIKPALAFPFTWGDLMRPSSLVSLVFFSLSVLFAGCSEPCITPVVPVGEQCGTTFCSLSGYCATDAGPPTCVSKKDPGAPCVRDPECSGGLCEVDGGCGPFFASGPSGQCP